MKHLLLALCVLPMLISSTALAEQYALDDLVIENPYTRTTPPMTPVGGGFMTITNNGTTDATLVSGTAEFAAAVEIHTMEMTDNVMKMRQLEQGLVIPAGSTVMLKPGGYHLMFINLTEQMQEDDRHKVMLEFAQAGEIEVEFVVKDINKMMDAADADKSTDTAHDHHKAMQHDDMGEHDGMKHDSKKKHEH